MENKSKLLTKYATMMGISFFLTFFIKTIKVTIYFSIVHKGLAMTCIN